MKGIEKKRSVTRVLAGVAAGVIAVSGVVHAAPQAADVAPDAANGEERPTVAYFGLGQTTCPYYPEPGGPCSPV